VTAVALAVLCLVLPITPAVRASQPVPEIIGGSEVSPVGKYPFMAAFVHHGADSYNGQFCAGALLTPEWVVTAAHCVAGEIDDDPGLLDVVVGRHDLTSAAGQRITAIDIAIHPSYNPLTDDNDIALVRLGSAASGNPVALPGGTGFDTAGTALTVIGWGSTCNDSCFPTKLREVAVDVVGDAECSSAYDGAYHSTSMICAGDFAAGGVDSCRGDSGGPLFATTGGSYILVGIVSWGAGCGDPGAPGVYARVSMLQTWVESIVPPSQSVGLVDPGAGLWYLRQGAESAQFYFGNPGDYPFVGDWDCDGDATPGLYRQSDGFVYLRNSNTQGTADVTFFFGNPGDVPIAGDFDGDGCDTVSIYRPAEGRFFIINALGENGGGLGAAAFDYYFGDPGDKPFVGDFDGDGEDTIGLHRESTGLVYFRNTHTQGVADNQFYFGDPGDRLIAGDWNQDGVDSPAVYRPTTTTFYFRYTNTQGNADEAATWGYPTWLPITGTFWTNP